MKKKSNGTILVIDTDKEERTLLRSALEDNGYSVIVPDENQGGLPSPVGPSADLAILARNQGKRENAKSMKP